MHAAYFPLANSFFYKLFKNGNELVKLAQTQCREAMERHSGTSENFIIIYRHL